MVKAALKKVNEEGTRPVFEGVRYSARQLWLAGIGVYASLGRQSLDYFRELVRNGEEAETQGKQLVSEKLEQANDRFKSVRRRVDSRLEKVEDRVGVRVGRVLKRAGVPSRAEIEALSDKLDGLNEMLVRTAKP
jgi:poly(hydroxyalkanoate) granule-associated protein